MHYVNSQNNQVIRCRLVDEGKCDCIEYPPEDNLKYLEWKFNRELHKNDWMDNFVRDTW